MKHIRSSIITNIELDYYPRVRLVYWHQKKDLLGRIVKEGYYKYDFRGEGNWYDDLSDYRINSDKELCYKPTVYISGEETLCRRFETDNEAKKFYGQLLIDLKEKEFIEFTGI